MSTLAIIVIVFVAIVLLLIVGGLVANARHLRAEDAHLRAILQEADQALAAARAAFAERSPAEVRELLLIQVVDRPGTEEDQALFRVVTDAGSEEILLMRQGDGWVAAGPVP